MLGGTGPGANPRMEFYNKFQREMEKHDRDFEKEYDEDLDTALIFVSIYSYSGSGGADTYRGVSLSLVYFLP